MEQTRHSSMEQKQAPPPHRVRADAWGCFVWMVELALGLAALGAVIMCFVNVFGSTIEVGRLASETACQGQSTGCEATAMMWERTPFAHSMQMSTSGGSRVVTCQRQYILIGAWSCAALDVRASFEPRTAKTVVINLPAGEQPKASKPMPSTASSSKANAAASAR